MKLIPIAMIIASAIFCSTIRERFGPTPTPTPIPLSAEPAPMPTESPLRPVLQSSIDPMATKSVPGTISGGVLNGKAKSLPKPDYPPAAKAVRASGSVSVQVMVDEKGNVVSATAVSGHPLLKQAAVEAAKNTRFSPTMLSGKAVKVSGILTFNFTPE